MTNFDRVANILLENLGVSRDEIRPDAKIIEDLQADSLDIVEIIIAMENEFSVQIEDQAADRIVTVQDIVDELDMILAGKRQATI